MSDRQRFPTIDHNQAIRFIETACRNWRHVPPLSSDDIADVADALTHFCKKHMAASEQAPELLHAEDRQKHAIAALEHALADARAGDLTGFAFAAIGRPGANQVAMAYSFDETDPAILHEMVDATRTLLVEVARGGQ